jgi:hypothetical protein
LICQSSELPPLLPYHHWNSMALSPLHDGTWLAKLTGIIAQAKEDKRKVDLALKPSPLNINPSQAQAEGLCMHTKGKEVAGKKLFTSSNCQNSCPCHK